MFVIAIGVEWGGLEVSLVMIVFHCAAVNNFNARLQPPNFMTWSHAYTQKSEV